MAQLHGDETAGRLSRALARLEGRAREAGLRPPRLRELPRGSSAARWPGGGLYGGAGKAFDWRLARRGSHGASFWPGGLDASNVAGADRRWRSRGAWMPARASKAHPGRKDHQKMSEFLQAAMAAASA